MRPEDPHAQYSPSEGPGSNTPSDPAVQAVEADPSALLGVQAELVANSLRAFQAGGLFAGTEKRDEDNHLFAAVLQASYGSLPAMQQQPVVQPVKKILSWMGDTVPVENPAPVELPAALKPPPAPQVYTRSDGKLTGYFKQDNTHFGFVMGDNGNEFFCLPMSCRAFGLRFPPVGTRVAFDVTPDLKTGRQRADDVVPLDPYGTESRGSSSYGASRSGGSDRSSPYH